MILLLTRSLASVQKLDRPDIGRLLTPRHYAHALDTSRLGIEWACDNDAFSGFHEPRYLNMLAAIAGTRGCRFVTAPDIVEDAEATLDLFSIWHRTIREHGLPVALVGQDGVEDLPIPWGDLGAIFIGGSTEWKLSQAAADLAAEARARGKWVHMGRVNSIRRLSYARQVGCHSADGSRYSRFSDNYVDHALDALGRGEQLALAEPSSVYDRSTRTGDPVR